MISRAVPNLGLDPPLAGSETAGEFRTTVGSACIRQSLPGSSVVRSDGHAQRGLTDHPNPEDLADPESCEFEKVGSHLVEPVIACW
jgi:hypothetical protein